MGSFNPYYTGGDPSYFPAPHQGGKSSLLGLVRFIAGAAIVSMVITVAVMRLFWQAPAAKLSPAEAQALKRTIPEVHLAVATPEPRVKHGGRRHEETARGEGKSEPTHTTNPRSR